VDKDSLSYRLARIVEVVYNALYNVIPSEHSEDVLAEINRIAEEE